MHYVNAIAISRMSFVVMFCCMTLSEDIYSQTTTQPRVSGASTPVLRQTVVPQSKVPPVKAEGLAVQSPKDFTGTWKLQETAAQTNQRIKAIENATASFSRFMRGRARDAMNKKTAPPKELKMVDAGSQLKISKSGREFVVGTDGKPAAVVFDGKNATMQAGKREGKLIVVVRMNEMTKTTICELSVDGQTLKQQTEISSTKLATPIRFTNYFRRDAKLGLQASSVGKAPHYD